MRLQEGFLGHVLWELAIAMRGERDRIGEVVISPHERLEGGGIARLGCYDSDAVPIS